MHREPVAEHPDRLRWNARYETSPADFTPHPFPAEALSAEVPEGRVLELACGRSGTALALAEAGRNVVAVDVSDVALAQLAAEASRRGLAGRVECVLTDAGAYSPEPNGFAVVMATRYWDPDVFAAACRAVAPGGLLLWEALADVDGGRWHVEHGELSARLPAGFEVLREATHQAGTHRTSRLIARRALR